MSAGAASRPLSPHLGHYRPEITMVLSVLHRASGIVLGLGAVALAWWLAALALQGQALAATQWLMTSWLGWLALVGWTLALCFHLANGIRHLFWDAGLGFEIRTARRSGWAVGVLAVVLTALVWLIALI